MGSFHARNGPGELLARYSFLEPLLEGRRVLEVGAARVTDGASALFLAERGAVAVLSIEPEEADLEGARRTGRHPFVQFQAMLPTALRAGTFDLILLADGTSLASTPSEAADLRRLLAPGGRLVTAIPAGGAGISDLVGEPAEGEPPSYEAFVNALSDHFSLVEVAAQTATIGWVFGMTSEDEPEIAMDGTLAGTPDTTRYVAIAGEEPSGLSGFTVVALPVAPLLEVARARTQGSAGELETAQVRAAEAAATVQVAEEAIAAERARVAEQAAALAALEVERDTALHARESAVAEAEALRAEREEAIRARDTARSEADAAVAERDRALEAHRQREAEREALVQERDEARGRELEARRSREVALAEAVALGESLARSEAMGIELARDRDAALAARDQAAAEAAEHRLSLDEARLAGGSLDGQLSQARDEAARLAARLQELEQGGAWQGPTRVLELEAMAEAERTTAFELRARLDRLQAAAVARDQELEEARAALATAEEERGRLEVVLAEGHNGALESEAALQAARSEAQAGRAALEAALDRATRAEARTSELEEALEKGGQGQSAAAAAREEEVAALQARIAELETASSAVPGAGVPSDAEGLAAQLAEANTARATLQNDLAELKESSDRKVAEARRAAYDAAAKAEEARREAEAAHKRLEAVETDASGAVQTAREWGQVREALEAQVAELNARLDAEAERTGILSAQHAEARAQLETAVERDAPVEMEERVRRAEERAEDFARRVVEAEARARELDAVAAQGMGGAAEALEIVEFEDPEGLGAQLAELKAARASLEKELSEARTAADTAEAQVAEIAAELQAVRWEKDEIDQRLQAAQAGGGGMGADVSRIRDELATRMAELALQRREVERLEAVVASLSVRTELSPAADGAEAERKLAEALQRAADAEAALRAQVDAEAPTQAAPEDGEPLRRATQERLALAAQVAERDGKIARLQREVADKTERLGRLAKELGELKAKGLGKIFR
jgi:hypothetical protein